MKKIMFNDRYGLTEAVLSGRKTQTRRIIPNDILCACDLTDNPPMVEDSNGYWHDLIKASRYKVGEVVAVAQPYIKVASATATWLTDKWKPKPEFEAGWNNKMFVRADLMPHRIRITNIRLARLNDITEADCIAEGIYQDECTGHSNGNGYAFEISKDQHGNILAKKWYKSPREAYAALIDRISGKRTWESNPWVFVYDFELVK